METVLLPWHGGKEMAPIYWRLEVDLNAYVTYWRTVQAVPDSLGSSWASGKYPTAGGMNAECAKRLWG